MSNKLQLRRDTAANWEAANPTLAQGEIGLILDNNGKVVDLKLGDGTKWKNIIPTLGHTVQKAKNETLDTILEYGPNLFERTKAIAGGYWNASGLIDSANYYYTNPIWLRRGISYTATFNRGVLGDNPIIAQVNESSLFVSASRGSLSEDSTTITFVPSEDGYYSFNIGYVQHVDTFMVCLTDEYPTAYKSYEKKLNKDIRLSITKSDTDFWQIEKSVNMFDKNNVNTGFWSSSGLQNAEGYFNTKPLFLETGKTYKYPKLMTLGSNLYLAQVSVNGVFIKGQLPEISEDEKFLLFTPPTTGYYSFNVGTTVTMETFMIAVAEEYPEDYVEFYTRWILPDLFLEKENLSKDIASNPLYKKKVTFNGDSICYGAGFLGGYGKIIAERNNMVYTNRGVGGGTITAELYSQSGAARHWISRDIPHIDPTSDYVILEGGVNDASLNPDLGEITEGFTSALDDTTFCGAFESMIKQCYELFPNAKLGFVIVHQMTARFCPNGEFYQKAVAILEKWGVPYLDLAIQAPPLNFIESLKTTYTSNADGWHPNELGYKTFYCDKIESWMKTL